MNQFGDEWGETIVSDEMKLGRFRVLPFRILIVGPSGCGKTTLAKRLGEILNVGVGETSEVLIQKTAELMTFASPVFSKTEWARVLAVKSAETRHLLYESGNFFTECCPDYLMSIAAKSGAMIIVGARRRSEIEAWFSIPTNSDDVVVEIINEAAIDPCYTSPSELKGLHIRVGFALSALEPTVLEVAGEIESRVRALVLAGR